MKVRKVGTIKNGMVDCEIEHPEHGWIPFTSAKDDPGYYASTVFAEIEARPGVKDFEFETRDEAAAKKRAAEDAEAKVLHDALAARDEALARTYREVGGPDVWHKLTEKKQAEWSAYWDKLRTAEEQPGWPDKFKLPEAPK